MRTILCYGDSNTWGYDPRSLLADRYSEPWCSLLAARTGATVVNLGENGRRIPCHAFDFRILEGFLQGYPYNTAFLIMLGTNDILSGCSNATIIERMDTLLHHLKQNHPGLFPMLITPPPIKLAEFCHQAKDLGRSYSILAEKYDIPLWNSQEWNLSLAFDGVHLTEADHNVFANRIHLLLSQLYPSEFTLGENTSEAK